MLSAGKTEGVSSSNPRASRRFAPASSQRASRISPPSSPSPPGSDGEHTLLPGAWRTGEDKLQAPHAGAHPLRHLRMHSISGTGHRDIQEAGRLLARQADMIRRAMSKKKTRCHRRGAPRLHLRRRGPGHPGLRQKRRGRGDSQQHLRRDPGLLPATPSTRRTP